MNDRFEGQAEEVDVVVGRVILADGRIKYVIRTISEGVYVEALSVTGPVARLIAAGIVQVVR